MADASIFDPIRMPVSWLTALDWRAYHFYFQRYHYLVRMVHILSMSAFYGGIFLLDLRLMGLRVSTSLRALSEQVVVMVHASFAVAMLSGVALFLYDPVHMGARAYMAPKLLAILAGLLNALVFHIAGYKRILSHEGQLSAIAKIAGATSLLCWTLVIAFSSLNAEDVPRVFLR